MLGNFIILMKVDRFNFLLSGKWDWILVVVLIGFFFRVSVEMELIFGLLVFVYLLVVFE